MATAVIGLVSSLESSIGALFQIGHGDDSVDSQEEQILKQFLAPVADAAAGTRTTMLTWENITKTAQAINPASSPLTADQAAQIISQGDQAISKACTAFSQTGPGYPCPCVDGVGGYTCGVRSGYKGGGGKDIAPLWGIIRAKLVVIAGGDPTLAANPSNSSLDSLFGLTPTAAGGSSSLIWTVLIVSAVIALFLITRR